MIIVAGHLIVDPAERQDYLETCREVIASARVASGCFDFSIAADLIEANRINVYERWRSTEALEAFRGDGPSEDQQGAIRDADIAQYDIAPAPPLIPGELPVVPRSGNF